MSGACERCHERDPVISCRELGLFLCKPCYIETHDKESVGRINMNRLRTGWEGRLEP